MQKLESPLARLMVEPPLQTSMSSPGRGGRERWLVFGEEGGCWGGCLLSKTWADRVSPPKMQLLR